MDCPICRAAGCAPALEKEQTVIYACGACEVRFWLPADDFTPEALYDDGYFSSANVEAGYDDYAASERSLRDNFRRRIERFDRPFAGARLLDLGAAYGYAVDEAATLGWAAYGMEISHSVALRARRTIPGRILAGDGLALPFGDQSFDLVTLWDVIEHLRDPHAAVEEVARVLRPGGRLVLTTGDVRSLAARLSGSRWHLYTLPEHLFFHSRESLRVLLEMHDLTVESVRAEGSRYSLGYLVERLRKSLFGWDGGTFADSSLGQVAVPVNLFDIVTVCATRGTASPDTAA